MAAPNILHCRIATINGEVAALPLANDEGIWVDPKLRGDTRTMVAATLRAMGYFKDLK